MKKFPWKEEYCVGNSKLDEHHKQMFIKGDHLFDLQPTETKQLVMELFEYTKLHFKEEEQHMRDIHYPHVASHQKEHDKMTAKLTELIQDFVPSEENTAKIKMLLLEWLVIHILTHDKKYFEFANQK